MTSAFDPMIAKIIVHGADRAEAIENAQAALAGTVLLGCKTNSAFLQRFIADPAFKSGDFHTGTIDERPDLTADPAPDADTLAQVLAAAALALKPVRDAADAVPALHAHLGAWRS